MITTIFSKSRPFNYILVTCLLTVCFVVIQSGQVDGIGFGLALAKKAAFLVILVGSLFITNFVTKRNGLSKDSTYPFLFFFLFLILFPSVLLDSKIVVSNFFLLLAMRRLVSLQSLITPKEKIFDASLWVFVAALFHFWAILFILLVFISIFFHVSRDYRNWIIPYIAFFGVATTYLLFAVVFNKTLISDMISQAQIDLTFTYFRNKFENIAFSIFTAIAFLFFFAQLISLPGKPLILHASYKKVVFCFVIAVVVFVISPEKDNSLLVYTFMPLSIMATSYIESLQIKTVREVALLILIAACLLSYFAQL
ncbi:MAG: hypothetical protein CFE23_04260 [Flavobacterium sp. BFFFF1]|uniref:DUF6427 family protein n=1 Tax=Flavobacterium sp. BFFFF1 TaxID=2015557 RepID=UPI000BC95A56|nr:DUF6427 family protein [Flavobacterium sp. BFFFF1]OYU81316.1 MAG: hypothetical protein CFE23_04260 [Flavobacterium sp. BFFFF1]